MSTDTDYHVEPARESDVPVILRMIRGLAEYERMSEEVVVTEADLRDALFSEHPAAEVLIAYDRGEPAGFALFFQRFSTFQGARGIYLEDIFVDPRWRGRGMGRLLMARLANIAVSRGWKHLEWSVLDWNPAITFYQRIGAEQMNDWLLFHLRNDALERLAVEGAQQSRD